MNRFLQFWINEPSGKAWCMIPLSYMLFLQFLTGIPKPEYLEILDGPESLWELSKLIYDYPYYLQDLSHFPLFAALAWLWSWYLGGPKEGTRFHGTTLALVIAMSYGVFNEMIQAIIPSRFPSAGDLVMNLSGAWCGAWLHLWFLKRSKRLAP
ncbi:MAG: VanZ family protein [Opitutales bacterium]|jgi:hypothetical protein